MKNLLGSRLKDEVEKSYSEEIVRKLGLKTLEFEEKVLYRPDVIERIRLRNIKEIFRDRKALKEMNSSEVIYKTYLRQNKGISYRFTVLNPGKIGKEFYKTRGHFHRKASDTEMIFGMEGKGIVFLQHQRTDRCIFAPLEQGNLVHVPPYYAHRMVNIGDEELVFLSFFPRTSGSDYRSIDEEGGFKYWIVERNGKTELQKNPDFKA